MNLILSIQNNTIQIIKPDSVRYEVIYTKNIKNPKKDLYEAYKTYLKLGGGTSAANNTK